MGQDSDVSKEYLHDHGHERPSSLHHEVCATNILGELSCGALELQWVRSHGNHTHDQVLALHSDTQSRDQTGLLRVALHDEASALHGSDGEETVYGLDLGYHAELSMLELKQIY